MIKDVTIPARLCRCEICFYDWISIASQIPVSCQNRDCRSREWNGKKPKRIPEKKPELVFPKPVRTRKVDDEDIF